MKSRLLSILFLVLCLLFAFVFGAYRGWQKDYAAVEETRISLTDQISTQAETASNILTVAFRHLDRDDESILALTGIRDTLRSHAALADKAAAAKQLGVQAEALLDKLAPLESVQKDDRDNMYVSSMLPRMLRESTAPAVKDVYNAAAADFNDRFEKNAVSAFIAAQLGIHPFELFGSAE